MENQNWDERFGTWILKWLIIKDEEVSMSDFLGVESLFLLFL